MLGMKGTARESRAETTSALCGPAARFIAEPRRTWSRSTLAASHERETKHELRLHPGHDHVHELAGADVLADAEVVDQVQDQPDVKDAERVRAKVAGEGFDGAVVVRLAGVDRQVNYVPGTAYWGPAPYGSLWGYWAYGWGGAYDAGYMKTENVVTLESNVYAIANEKLIWSSRSESVSPVSVDAMMDDLVAATVREMKKQRVL